MEEQLSLCRGMTQASVLGSSNSATGTRECQGYMCKGHTYTHIHTTHPYTHNTTCKIEEMALAVSLHFTTTTAIGRGHLT